MVLDTKKLYNHHQFSQRTRFFIHPFTSPTDLTILAAQGTQYLLAKTADGKERTSEAEAAEGTMCGGDGGEGGEWTRNMTNVSGSRRDGVTSLGSKK